MLGNKFNSFVSSLKGMTPNKVVKSVDGALTSVVNKILEAQTKEPLADNVRKEIMSVVVAHNNKEVLPAAKYFGSVVLHNAPKNLYTLKNFRKNIATTLIADAKKRLEEKNTVDAHVVADAHKSHGHGDHHKTHGHGDNHNTHSHADNHNTHAHADTQKTHAPVNEPRRQKRNHHKSHGS